MSDKFDLSDVNDEQLDAIFAGLAQGVINICEGHTTIEADSRVHRAMSALVELRQSGRLDRVEPPTGSAEKLARKRHLRVVVSFDVPSREAGLTAMDEILDRSVTLSREADRLSNETPRRASKLLADRTKKTADVLSEIADAIDSALERVS